MKMNLLIVCGGYTIMYICKHKWSLFYYQLYLEKKMHGKQFNHSNWCLQKFRQEKLNSILQMAKRYQMEDMYNIPHFDERVGDDVRL